MVDHSNHHQALEMGSVMELTLEALLLTLASPLEVALTLALAPQHMRNNVQLSMNKSVTLSMNSNAGDYSYL